MAERNGSVADAAPGNWVDAWLPAAAKPYARLARLDRPIGWWLLMWPCWWSAALAAVAAGRPFPDPWHLALFMVGAIAMRGAGCTYNDIVDRDFDARVARTRSRPIPSGQVSVRGAWAFLVAQALVGLGVLLQFNGFAIATGVASLLTVVVYPFMKRVTYWPQAFLGLAFSWGALMGWAAVFGRLDAAALVLYAGSILWVIGYDTIYAHQDKEDDLMVGVRSTARLFGPRTRPMLALFYAGAVLLLAVAGWLAGARGPYYVGLALAGVHLGSQVARLDTEDPAVCLRLFKSNRDVGWIVFFGTVAEALWQAR
jgi:4-hydroxybenzoate polyprenyltransferase